MIVGVFVGLFGLFDVFRIKEQQKHGFAENYLDYLFSPEFG